MLRSIELTGTKDLKTCSFFHGCICNLERCPGKKLLAADAAGTHPVTCRTRKLSLRALMVLCGVRTGEQTAASLDYTERKFHNGLPLFLFANFSPNRDIISMSQNDYRSPIYMPTFNINQKTIFDLLSDKRSIFLIPDYQRPYAWDEVECSTLWDDVCSFAIPDNNSDSFDKNDEYFLGPIVIFKNGQGKLEVIDGQQRLTTLVLLLRAFYHAFGEHMHDSATTDVKKHSRQ